MREPEVTAKNISEVYKSSFGGKDKGRFRISRAGLTILSGRKILRQAVIDSIFDVLLNDYGIFMIDLESEFAFINESIIRSYREVPEKIVSKYGDDCFDVNEKMDDEESE